MRYFPRPWTLIYQPFALTSRWNRASKVILTKVAKDRVGRGDRVGELNRASGVVMVDYDCVMVQPVT